MDKKKMWAKAESKETPKTDAKPEKAESAPEGKTKSYPNLMGKMYGKKG